MTINNLWGDLSNIEPIRTPKQILQEQANFLSTATNGLLIGKVTNEEIDGDFVTELVVRVPRLNNYEYTLISVFNKIDIYPLKISVPGRPGRLQCDSEQKFVAVLKRTLSSSRTKKILTQLISHAK